MAKELDAFDKQFHARMLQTLATAQAGMQLWSSYVAMKYELTPSDTLAPDGSIVAPALPI